MYPGSVSLRPAVNISGVAAAAAQGQPRWSAAAAGWDGGGAASVERDGGGGGRLGWGRGDLSGARWRWRRPSRTRSAVGRRGRSVLIELAGLESKPCTHRRPI